MTSVFLRPDADSSDGSWLNEASSGTNLFASVDDTTSTGADSDYIRSSSAQGDKVRLRLSDPGVSVVSPMVVRYRVKAEALPAALVGRLYQGTGPGTLIAYWEELPTTSFATYTYTLTTTEFNTITDFNDLYVEFEYDSAAPHLSGNIDLWFEAGTYYDSSLDPNSDPAHLMLHMNGTDASTTFTDEKGHTVTAGGNAQIDTAQSKFGGASALFDGTGDYLLLDGRSDFTFGTGDFTIDMWVRLNGTGAFQVLYDGRPTAAAPTIAVRNTDVIYYYATGVDRITGTTALTTGAWYHIALTRSGTSTKLFLNGTQEGSTYTDSTDYAALNSDRPSIGTDGNTFNTSNLNGWIDELRVVKGTAMWTSNFTPPTAAYAVQTGVLNLLSCSRASTGYGQTVAGTLTNFAANELRVTDKGLLVEDARTNVEAKSQEFNDAVWIKEACTVTADQIAAPDGTTTADKLLVTNNGVFDGRLRQQATATLTADTNYTYSVYLKVGTTNTWVNIQASDFVANSFGTSFNLTGVGSLGTSSAGGDGTFTSQSIEALASGWYRCIFTGKFTAARNPYLTIQVGEATEGANPTINEFYYAWGAQVELGSFASSYIPTTTVSVTRAADAVTIIGNANSLLIASVGSTVVDYTAFAANYWSNVIGTDTGDGYAHAALVFDNSVPDTVIANRQGGQMTATYGNSLTVLTGVKAGAAWNSATPARSLVGGGGTVATDGGAVTLLTSTELGHLGPGSPSTFIGRFRRLTIWNTKLADATLQGLTYP